jgi:hypothetical protein
MKRIFLLFVSVALVGTSLISCSSDDNGGSSGDLVGKWYPEKSVYTFMGQNMDEPHEHLCPSKKDYVEFKSNGTFLAVDHEEDCQAYEDEGTWVKNGNELTITGDGETGTVTIVSLTSSKLVVKTTMNEGGMNMEFEVHYKK